MRILLGQLAPRKGAVAENLARLDTIVRSAQVDLAVFPELYLSGYRAGDRFHHLALSEGDATWSSLGALAGATHGSVVVGAPVRSAERTGELHNAALLATPDGAVRSQVKRYLPSYGPFEEGSIFTPTDSSRAFPVGAHRLGLEICYDAFFPEVSRDLGLAGADLLVTISAAPVTSRRLFEKVLPARAVENAAPLVYVNRVGAEDGVVFGGGSMAWDARGEPVAGAPLPFERIEAEESVVVVELDPSEAHRWRPFRPVLRDVASRRAAASSPGDR